MSNIWYKMCTGAGSPFPLIKASKIMKVEAAVSDVVGEEEWAALRSNVVWNPTSLLKCAFFFFFITLKPRVERY